MVQSASVVALLYVLDFCAWVIMLGGIGAWQDQCNRKDYETGLPVDAVLCGSADAQLNWWATWFQFFVLLFLFVVYFSRQGVSYRVSLMVMLAMVTTLLFTTTNKAFNIIKNASGGLESAAQANAAGSIITMICNMLLIIVVGGDLGLSNASAAPAVPMSSQGQDLVAVQMSSSYNPSYGTKPPI